MDRLGMIRLADAEWANRVEDFVVRNSELRAWLPYASLHPRPCLPAGLDTIKKLLLYYVAFSGVHATYGQKCYDWIINGELQHLMPGKRAVVSRVLALPEMKTREEFIAHVVDRKVIGVEIGACHFVKQNFFGDTDITYPTDRVFRRGLQRIFHLDTLPTPLKAKCLAEP